MLRKLAFASLLAFSTAALADEAPTVTLTAQELQALIAAEAARVQAAPAIEKVQRAFAPKPAVDTPKSPQQPAK